MKRQSTLVSSHDERIVLDAFQRQLIELLPRLRRFARTLARPPADPDDLVQTAVERALARRSQWTPGTRLDWWTMRIMKNAWIDEARAGGRRPTVLTAPDDLAAVRDPAAAGQAERAEGLSLAQAMQALPEEQRLAVSLVLVEGLSYAEAAEVLEIPPGTLTSRLVRGRMALMSQLEAAS
jgi:RNA polymerase sigma-70 factor (ECF subfamily)